MKPEELAKLLVNIEQNTLVENYSVRFLELNNRAFYYKDGAILVVVDDSKQTFTRTTDWRTTSLQQFAFAYAVCKNLILQGYKDLTPNKKSKRA